MATPLKKERKRLFLVAYEPLNRATLRAKRDPLKTICYPINAESCETFWWSLYSKRFHRPIRSVASSRRYAMEARLIVAAPDKPACSTCRSARGWPAVTR